MLLLLLQLMLQLLVLLLLLRWRRCRHVLHHAHAVVHTLVGGRYRVCGVREAGVHVVKVRPKTVHEIIAYKQLMLCHVVICC